MLKLRGCRVVLIDHRFEDVRSYAETLSSEGALVITCSSVERTVELFEKGLQVDIAILNLDIRLRGSGNPAESPSPKSVPGLGAGRLVALYLRSRMPTLPIVLLSSQPGGSSVRGAPTPAQGDAVFAVCDIGPDDLLDIVVSYYKADSGP